MKHHISSILLAFAIGQASASATLVQYDADSDGDLSAEEFKAFYHESESPPIVQFDANADGTLSDDELAALAAELAAMHIAASNSASAFADEGGSKSFMERLGLLVRESHAEVNLGSEGAALAESRGANFSMTQDMASDSRVISMKGSILRPLSLGRASRHWLLPGIEFNRLTNETEPAREIDSLTFRIGSEFSFDSTQFGGVRLRVNPLVTTNFGFDVDLRALEVQVEPRWGLGGLGAERRFGPMSIHTRLLFQAEYGEVVDAGGRADLREGDAFARAGAKFGTRFWPVDVAFVDGLSGSLSYEWHQDLSGDLRARKLFVAGLYYQLDPLGQVTLESKYIRGDTSVALEDEETWTIGLGVKL
ncbi:MAG: hypothetical protein OXF72_00745 [Gammaproteobacteria bacterium]|nr:hypothetical protein [Gammaproteobacteria bacterium]MCY4323823.1 hypothetical protein [Gammaproteobacteria bacterium]